MPGDFNYQVFVNAQAWTGASQLESLTFRAAASGLSVTVTGPDRVARGGLYTYHAAAASCDERDEDGAQLEVRGARRGGSRICSKRGQDKSGPIPLKL